MKYLTAQEKWLRLTYSKVLNLCNSAEAIREGAFFDLMYVNLRHTGMDPHRQFAFLRYTKNQKLLIIVNFAENEREVEVKIPRLAVDMAELPEGNLMVKDLLTGLESELKLKSDQGVRVHISGRGALVLELPASHNKDKQS